MNEMEKQIMDEYARNYNIESISYEILGRMLDEAFVERRLAMFGIRDMYIYGGTYLAAQLYRAGKSHAMVKGVVDKAGRLAVNEPISVLNLDEFRKVYGGEKIIVTPLRFFREIREELRVFADEREIISIGELMLGIAGDRWRG